MTKYIHYAATWCLNGAWKNMNTFNSQKQMWPFLVIIYFSQSWKLQFVATNIGFHMCGSVFCYNPAYTW